MILRCCYSLLILFSLPCLASKMQGYEVVNFNELPKVEYDSITGKDVANVLPYKKLKEGDSGHEINNKILDQSVNSFLKSDYVQSSGIGKTAKSVEDGVKTDIAFSDPDSDIQHKVSLQYQAFQREARLRYSGLINFHLKYKLGSRDYTAELTQDVNGKELVLGHKVETDELEHIQVDSSTLSMRWNW